MNLLTLLAKVASLVARYPAVARILGQVVQSLLDAKSPEDALTRAKRAAMAAAAEEGSEEALKQILGRS